MKYCTTCRSQYTDDTLRFCLQDGSRLEEVRDTETPTVVLDETPTITRQRVTSQSYETTPGVPDRDAEKKRSIVVPVVVASLGAAALFIAGVAAAWIYLSGRKIENGNNTIGANTLPSPANAAKTPRVSPTPSGNNSTVPSPSPTSPLVDRGKAEKEVSDTIERWNSQAEDLDLNSYMQNYAQRVDYYNRKGLDKASVREDKARAFGMYRSILIEMPNMKISVDASGEVATAEFDKVWDFRGDRDSSGKVRSELRLRREGDRWLITGERDIKVYYINR
jgi:hypothetical protein